MLPPRRQWPHRDLPWPPGNIRGGWPWPAGRPGDPGGPVRPHGSTGGGRAR